jgi:hypothetical protein
MGYTSFSISSPEHRLEMARSRVEEVLRVNLPESEELVSYRQLIAGALPSTANGIGTL